MSPNSAHGAGSGRPLDVVLRPTKLALGWRVGQDRLERIGISVNVVEDPPPGCWIFTFDAVGSPRVIEELRSSPAEGRIDVLLADDDDRFVESLRVMVDEQPELSVVGVARDGLEAIELVEELEPQAVVIDLHMPRLDGVSALARMRQDHPSLCLIAITADAAPDLHRAVEEAGADAVFMKENLQDSLAERLVAARQPAVM